MAGFSGDHNTGFEVYDGAIVVITSVGDEVEIDYSNIDDIVETLRAAGRGIAAADGDTLDDHDAELLDLPPGKVAGGVRLPWPSEGHPGDLGVVFGHDELRGERMSAKDAAHLVEHLLREEEEEYEEDEE
jgi:hypothetical protein